VDIVVMIYNCEDFIETCFSMKGLTSGFCGRCAVFTDQWPREV
jgi:hypothetical protein